MSADEIEMNTERLQGFLDALSRRIGTKISRGNAARQDVAEDRSGLDAQIPYAVVHADCRDDVVALCALAEEFRVGVVPRGAGTGKVGGAIPTGEQVVLDVSRMNRIKSIHVADQYAVVEPGVLTAQLDREAAAHGLMFPPDPASWETSTIGGNIATNAGGPRALKYGVTGQYVWGVEVVIPGGKILRAGRRSLKGVTGFDVTSLIVGSEGTLGVVTEATIRLIPEPPRVEGVWFGVESVLHADALARRIFDAGFLPRALELLDEEALAAVRSEREVPGESSVAVHVELDGYSPSLEAELDHLIGVAEAEEVFRAHNDLEREMLRAHRRAASDALKKRYPYKLSDDIAVPRSQMHVFLEKAHEIARAQDLHVAAYGHLGDGNLHFNRLASTQQERDRAEQLRTLFLELALSLGGTLSAEHGIGLAKRDLLPLEHDENLIALQRRLKHAFDPHGIMNPGKVLPLDHSVGR